MTMVETIIIVMLYVAAVGYLLNVRAYEFQHQEQRLPPTGAAALWPAIASKKIEAEIQREKAATQ
jgi:hypothetical protein